MGKPNPKLHDGLVKWLIASFTEDFFEHYFPDIRIVSYEFIDKEFVRKYEALKESLKGDLFLVIEAETGGEICDIVIRIEHQSERKDAERRVYRYSCYAWLLREKPVWSIVIYTDDAVWRKPVPDSFWHGFSSRDGKQFYRFDVIKVKKEKSSDLIKKHSLLCKLLALKADDRDADPEYLIREIYRAVSEMKPALTDDQLLLVGQWVNAYKKVPEETAEKIKKEVRMEFVETTIGEHFVNIGRVEGEAKGKAEGKTEGRIEGKIELLENLFITGVLTKEQFEKMSLPLRRELNRILAESEKQV